MNLSRLLRNNWDRAAAVVAALASLVALLLGWRGVSNATLATEQLPYIASGIGLGFFFLGIAGTLWLSANLRDAWRRLGDVHRVLVDAEEDPALAEPRVTVANISRVEPSAPRRARPVRAADR